MKNKVLNLLTWLVGLAVGVLIILILNSTIFFSRYLLGDLKFSYHQQHEFKLSIDNKTIGYIFYEQGWFIDKQFAYGTLLKQSGSDDEAYFLYDCRNNQYQIIDDKNQFKILLNQHNLAWKNFRHMGEVEEWSAVKKNKRKFSSVCPK